MAGDWIKVEKTTPDKPELMAIARLCNVSVEEAFTAWFRFYSWADSQTADGFVRFLSAKDADRIGTICGLGDALQKTGWVNFTEEGCSIKNWERHNGESAKRRAMDSDRKIRKRSAKCPENVRNDGGQIEDKMRTREEKRREEIITDKSTYQLSTSVEIRDKWNALAEELKLAKVEKLTGKRTTSIHARCGDGMLSDLSMIFEEIRQSDFLRGVNNQGWQISFDWLFGSPSNWVKVREGNYRNKPRQPSLIAAPTAGKDYSL